MLGSPECSIIPTYLPTNLPGNCLALARVEKLWMLGSGAEAMIANVLQYNNRYPKTQDHSLLQQVFYFSVLYIICGSAGLLAE